jgi:elongator complex protein 1
VERGSRLVVANGFKTILQMPRGNLEGVQPRILLLKEVIALIKETRYGKAFLLLRQHKLDINLIYDVDP